MFKKKNFSKYEHVMFVEDFRSGVRVFDLLVRYNLDTGLPEYKRVYVKKCVHRLYVLMDLWFKNK